MFWWMAELEVSAGLVIPAGVSQGKEFHCLEKKVPCSSEQMLQDEANRNAKAWEGKVEIQLC